MNITDVPTSGKYFQRGAIAALVVQMIDAESVTPDNPEGDPIPLQTATGLSISILYPDGTTSQSFTAELYSDGSDGRIKYITKNDGVTVDLSQVGLYKIQGNAVIGGVPLPPSYESDFYVLKNTFGGTVMPIATPSGIVLFDSDTVRYVGTVNPSGELSFAQQSEGPTTYLYFNELVMKDSEGIYWTITMGTDGEYDAAPGGTFPHALNYFTLVDQNNKTWVITISTQGVLTPA